MKKSLIVPAILILLFGANPSLQVSRVEELIAEQDVVRARSGFLPRVKAQSSQTIYDAPTRIQITAGPIPEAGSFPMTDRNFWSAQVTVDQTIFDFWATSSRYQAAILGQAGVLGEIVGDLQQFLAHTRNLTGRVPRRSC